MKEGINIHYFSFLLVKEDEKYKTIVYKCRKLKTAIKRLLKSGWLDGNEWQVDYEVEILDANKKQFKSIHSYLSLYDEDELKGYIN